MEALWGCYRNMPVVLSQVVVTVVVAVVVLLAGSQAAPVLEYRIYEETANKSLVGDVAQDGDLYKKFPDQQWTNLRFSFLEQPNSHAELFHIEENTGIIRTWKRVDRDALCPFKVDCQVKLDVAVLGPAQYFEMISVVVHIRDINDNSPKFLDNVVRHNISESAVVGTSIGLSIADDPDSGDNGIQRYALTRGAGVFELQETVGLDGSTDLRLVLKQKLDREAADSYQLRVVAYDGGSPSKSGSVLVNVSVTDANDNGPVFNNDTYVISIPEDTPINHTLLQVKAFDSDMGINAKLRYSFSQRTGMTHGDLFGINIATGDIFLKKPLDFEEATQYHLVIVAQDSGPESKAAQATVIVKVLDVNDNSPSIKVNTLTTSGEAQISESADNGTFVAHISAVDYDSGTSGEFTCRLDGMGFRLEQLSIKTQYKIVTAAVLDREAISQFEVVLICMDRGTPPLTASQTLTINVLDENDHSPKFSQSTYYTNLLENNKPDAFLIQVHAYDEDYGPNSELDFTIHDDPDGFFKIHTLGIIRAAVPLDYERAPEVRFTVTASDRGIPPNTAMAVIVVAITDINDEAPQFNQLEYSFSVFENEPPDTGVGQVIAVDLDSNPDFGVIEYTIIGPTEILDTFMIDSVTGDISTMRELDREENPEYVMTVEARNPGVAGMSSSVSVTVHVADENDNDPIVGFPVPLNNTVHVYNHVPVGFVVTRIRATDYDDGDNGKLHFSIGDEEGSGLFEIDDATGALSTREDISGIEGLIPVKIAVQDGGIPPRLAWAYLNVVVNKSQTYLGDMTPGVGSPNKTIMISLAVASLAIILVLVLAIACLKFHDRRDKRRASSYMCRTEAQKMLHGLKEFPENQDGSNSTNATPGIKRGPVKQLSFAGHNEDPPSPPQLKEYTLADDPEPVNRSFPDSGISGTSSQNSQSCPRYIDAISGQVAAPVQSQAPVMVYRASIPEGSTPSSIGETSRVTYTPHSTTQSYPHPHKVTPADRELEVQRYLKLLHGDPDSESACSNTDSGRGPSEEGELSHTGYTHLEENYLEHSRDVPSCDCESQSPCQPACPHTAAQHPADRLLPCHSIVAYGNQNLHGDSAKHRHLSGLSDGPIRTSSPHSKSGFYGNKPEELPVRSILKNNNQRHYRQPVAPSSRPKGITFTGTGVHPGVHYTRSIPPLNVHRDSNSDNQRDSFHGHKSPSIPGGVSGECEDNESVVSMDQRWNPNDIPDDATTTTSGSYVVDMDDVSQDLGEDGVRDTDV